MGSDATAMLAYGFPLREGRFVPDYRTICDEWDASEWPAQPEDKGDYKSPEWDVWREKLREWNKTPRHIVIELFCSDEHPRYAVICDALTIRVNWDKTEEITAETLLRATPEHDAAIKEFCERFQLPHEQPRWLLLARYF